MSDVEWNPETYLPEMLAEIPGYEELQDAVAAATDGLDARTVLELGTGTGETALRVLARHPAARWTGIDASEAMLARARERLPNADLRVSRLEDPLPERPVRPRRLCARRPPSRWETVSAICSRESRRSPTTSCSATSSSPSARRTP